jgi:hypothetical protein
MIQSHSNIGDAPIIDISQCRVRRVEPHLAVCLMNDMHCYYALPYGNYCVHPLVNLIAEEESFKAGSLQ